MRRLTWLLLGLLCSLSLTAIAGGPVGPAWDAPASGGSALCTAATTCTQTADLGAQDLITTGEALIGANANLTDFPNAKVVISGGNTGETASWGVGLACEATGTASEADAIHAVSSTGGAGTAIGVNGVGKVTATGVTGSAVGVYGLSIDTHAGGYNIGLQCYAANGATNACLEIISGGVDSSSDVVPWTLYDNSATAASFGSTGKTDLLVLDTTDSAEQVKVNGNQSVSGDFKLGDDVYPTTAQAATDAAPNVVSITSQGPILQATKPTFSAAANVVIAGTAGSRNIASVARGSCADATSTLTVTPTHDGAALTACVLTEGASTGANSFDCSGAASDADCITSIRSAFIATAACNTPLAVSTAGATTLGFGVRSGLSENLTVVSNGACIVMAADGANGTFTVAAPLEATYPTSARGLQMGVGGMWMYPASTTNTCFGGTGGTYPVCIYNNGTGGIAGGVAGGSKLQIYATPMEINATTNIVGVATIGVTGSTSGVRITGANSAKGQLTTLSSAVANCTFSGGGGSATCATTQFIPRGAHVTQVTGRVVTPGTTCTTCKAGSDANDLGTLDDNQYGSALECDVDTTTITMATAEAPWGRDCFVSGGCSITMTAVGGNCVSGVTAWTVHYESATAATAD